MIAQHQALLAALVAAQVAFLEYLDEDVHENKAIDNLLTCIEEARKLAKRIKKEG